MRTGMKNSRSRLSGVGSGVGVLVGVSVGVMLGVSVTVGLDVGVGVSLGVGESDGVEVVVGVAVEVGVAVMSAAMTKGRRSIWLAGMNATKPKAMQVTNPLIAAPPRRRRN